MSCFNLLLDKLLNYNEYPISCCVFEVWPFHLVSRSCSNPKNGNSFFYMIDMIFQLGLKPPPRKVAVSKSFERNYYIYIYSSVCLLLFQDRMCGTNQTRLQLLLTMSKFDLEPNVPWKRYCELWIYHSPWRLNISLVGWLLFGPTLLCRNFEERHSNWKKTSEQSHSHIFFPCHFFWI